MPDYVLIHGAWMVAVLDGRVSSPAWRPERTGWFPPHTEGVGERSHL